jgi:hypothetical protein
MYNPTVHKNGHYVREANRQSNQDPLAKVCPFVELQKCSRRGSIRVSRKPRVSRKVVIAQHKYAQHDGDLSIRQVQSLTAVQAENMAPVLRVGFCTVK